MFYAKRRDTEFWPYWLLLFIAVGLLIVGIIKNLAWCTKDGQQYDIGASLQDHIDSFFWFCLGVASAATQSIIGAAAGIWTIGVSVLSIGIKAPHVKTKNLISVIFCEASAVYGLIMAIVLAQMWEDDTSLKAKYKGFLVLGAGISVGAVNCVAGISIGVVGSGAALADGANPKVFIKLLIIEIFASAIGLFGLIVGVYMSSRA